MFAFSHVTHPPRLPSPLQTSLAAAPSAAALTAALTIDIAVGAAFSFSYITSSYAASRTAMSQNHTKPTLVTSAGIKKAALVAWSDNAF